MTLNAEQNRILEDIINSPELREIGRKAVEDELIQYRDCRISLMYRGNGLVIRESDGVSSSIIRMGMETALMIALKAIKKHLEEVKQ